MQYSAQRAAQVMSAQRARDKLRGPISGAKPALAGSGRGANVSLRGHFCGDGGGCALSRARNTLFVVVVVDVVTAAAAALMRLLSLESDRLADAATPTRARGGRSPGLRRLINVVCGARASVCRRGARGKPFGSAADAAAAAAAHSVGRRRPQEALAPHSLNL